jgi:hypothetical protein
MSDSIWKSYTLKHEEELSWSVGSVRLFLRRSGNDWMMRKVLNRTEETPDWDASDTQRWAFPASASHIRLSPCMPDRSLVVRPTQPLNLPPDSNVQFYFSIPLWVKVEIGEPKRMIEITRTETQTLSNTWFGDPAAGLFCYANKDFIRRDIPSEEERRDCVICPFRISNNAGHALNVDRICVHVKYLSIYETEAGLWSNEVTANFRGDGKETVVSHARSTPSVAGKPRQTFASDEKPEKHYSLQTFLHQGIFRKKNKEEA